MDFEIFDEETSKAIAKEHKRDMEDAIKAVGARRMALLTGGGKAKGEAPGSSPPLPPSEGGLVRRLSSMKSMFARKKAQDMTETSMNTTASAAPPLPAEADESREKNAASKHEEDRPPPQRQPSTEKEPATQSLNTQPQQQQQQQQQPQEAKAQEAPQDQLQREAGGAGPESSTARASTGPTPQQESAAEPAEPEIRVVPLEVREPSLGAAVVGHVVVLQGSCYVWAATEGSAAQGSLAAAVSTRFDGGMPTATPLLAAAAPPGALGAGAGAGGAEGASGGVNLSMAQRLCRRTGRLVFVSCDLSEDSQILVAAVEAKVVAILKE